MLDSGGIDVYRWFKTGSCCETITVNQSSGGTISPGTVNLMYGANPTFTITANSGYSIAQVTVDSVNQGAISSYTFSNVTGPHAISASFTCIQYLLTYQLQYRRIRSTYRRILLLRY